MNKKPSEVWTDSNDHIVYMKGIPREDPRLSWVCFREAKDMKHGSVTITLEDDSTFTFVAPFKRVS